MQLSWHWPWVFLAGVIVVLAVAGVTLLVAARHKTDDIESARTFSLDDDLNTESASRLFRQWRVLSRLAVILLVVALALATALVARPSTVDEGEEKASSRDIVLCLDVSGSALPYDREVIDTYRQLVDSFKGERIGLSIFNSTSRTVFPLTDDYELVSKQLDKAQQHPRRRRVPRRYRQDEGQRLSAISDWLEGTQNRKESTSLIGDGVVSCAAMLPGFAYGNASADNAERQRAASIVLATDNVVSGKPTYTLDEALNLTKQAQITVDGLFSGPKQSEADETTQEFKSAIEAHHGVFLTQSNGASVSSLVKEIESRRNHENESSNKAAMVDAPGWWTLALAIVLMVWLALAWRLRR